MANTEETKLKRILYMSRFSHNWTAEEINALSKLASQRNSKRKITGMLTTFDGLFFQIIEGPVNSINKLFEEITKDTRHQDISILLMEEQVNSRFFDNWQMRVCDLDKQPDSLEYSVKMLLKSLLQSYKIIGSYNQPGVLKWLKNGINPLNIAPRQIRKVVMFTDMVGFTKISKQLPPQEVIEIVTGFFEVITCAVKHFEGEVDKFIGDCVMASFPEEKASQAINAARGILTQLPQLSLTKTFDANNNKISCGFGFAIGEVIEGNVGACERLDYTILGDVVNTAQRLEKLTRTIPYSIAVSSELKDLIKDQFPWVSVGFHRLKGNNETEEIFSLEYPEVQKQII